MEDQEYDSSDLSELDGAEELDFDEEEEEEELPPGAPGAPGMPGPPGMVDDEDEEEEDDEDDAVAEARGEQEGETIRDAPDVEKMKNRIKQCVAVLGSKQVKQTGHDRCEFVDVLKSDLMNVYDYSEWLMGMFADIFGPAELVEFIEANEQQRPLTIRVNTLKVKRRDLVQSLTKRGINLAPLEKWSKDGLQIFDAQVSVSGTPEYLAGYYMIQSAASFLPVMALAPKEGESILDMSAAPGGKTSHIGQMMKNTGILYANDINKDRLKSLQANIHRLGVSNTIVSCYDGAMCPKHFGKMDRVLLDAPCTGTGVITRDPHIKGSKDEHDLIKCTVQQKKLILAAIDCCKVGGTIAYSTCSILVEENEGLIDYALKKRCIEVVDAGLPFGRKGYTKFRKNRFHPSVEHSRRFYPHMHNLDGFFVCKLKKLADGPNKDSKWYVEPKERRKRKFFADSAEFGKNKKRKIRKVEKHRKQSVGGGGTTPKPGKAKKITKKVVKKKSKKN
eukprot:TRINITY_DN65549_c10_g1_i1.p1 TRINITY_DN65549_c10_g1~~TRINITY_DN65549_c10_g1_i1.p1  ORF type:complete len:503 (+),score=81.02 TRINITY_DN65549_c10_g1_i1:37-1545(+)